MADAKLSDLTALAGADAADGDLLYVVDVSAGATGSKKITLAEFFKKPTITCTGTVTAKLFTNPDPGTSAGTSNEAFGSGAGAALAATSIGNTAFGKDALNDNTTADYSTAVGAFALQYCTGTSNIGLGYYAGGAITTGNNNVCLGVSAGGSFTDGTHNVCIGNNSMVYNATGDFNVIIGSQAGFGSSGLSNLNHLVLIGYEAGRNLRDAAYSVTAIGYQALKADVSGPNNVAVGHQCLMLATGTTGENTVMGSHAGVYVVGGQYNTYLGYSAGACQDAADYNTAVGRHALYGTYDAGAAGEAKVVTSDSQRNTAVGYHAAKGCTGGDDNVALGHKAGEALSTGSNNILIGSQTGDNLTTGSGNILIGHDLAAAAVDSASTVNIGALIYGVQDAVTANKRLGFFDITTPVAQANHIADATADAASCAAAINAILVVLENLGFVKKS